MCTSWPTFSSTDIFLSFLDAKSHAFFEGSNRGEPAGVCGNAGDAETNVIAIIKNRFIKDRIRY